MATYLLTWNPSESSVAELVTAWRRQCDGKGVQPEDSSCGSKKSIPVGARVFLHRQAVEPHGIVAAVWVARQSYQGKHWEQARSKKGV